MKPCRKAPAGYRCSHPDGHLGLCRLEEHPFWAGVNALLTVAVVLLAAMVIFAGLVWLGQTTYSGT